VTILWLEITQVEDPCV